MGYPSCQESNATRVGSVEELESKFKLMNMHERDKQPQRGVRSAVLGVIDISACYSSISGRIKGTNQKLSLEKWLLIDFFCLWINEHLQAFQACSSLFKLSRGPLTSRQTGDRAAIFKPCQQASEVGCFDIKPATDARKPARIDQTETKQETTRPH